MWVSALPGTAPRIPCAVTGTLLGKEWRGKGDLGARQAVHSEAGWGGRT